MSNIDWDFIGVKEGKRVLKGYVPKTKNMKSGVTIATGFDLGQRNLSDLAGLPKDIINILTPYLGIKGASAAEIASELNISDSQAKVIDEFSHSEVLNDLRSKWKAATGESFDDLPMNKATVIASVRFQHGDLERKTPNFWREVTNDDWTAAVKNLRNFGDDFPTRRNSEADYYLSNIDGETQKKRLDETLAVTAPADAPSRQLTNEELVSRVQGQIAASREPQPAPTTVGEEVDFETPQMDVEQDFVIADAPIKSPVELKSVVDDLPDTVEPDPEIRPTKSNQNLPTRESMNKSYTSLYGKPNTQYGEYIPSQLGNDDAYDYGVFDDSFTSVWGAAFRQHNFLPSLQRLVRSTDSQYQPEEGYDPFQDKNLIRELGGKDGLWRFMHSQSHAESMMKLENFKEDAEDMALLAATASGPAQTVATLATPTTFAPLAPVKVLNSASKTRRFVGGTAFTAAILAPEEMLIASQNEYRDASHSALALTALSLLGGTLTAKFGNKLSPTSGFTPTGSGGGTYKAAGANVSPERYRETLYATMEQDALKETGIGVEKLPWNPVLRMLKSDNAFVRNLAVGMVDVGGMMQKKVDLGEKMDQSVETTFRTKYLSPLLNTVRESDTAYLRYRGVTPAETDISRSMQMIKMSAGDLLNRSGGHLTETQFRIRVAKAMRRGDVDDVGDAASEYVTQAAQSYRKNFNFIKQEAERVRLFEAQILREIQRVGEQSPEGIRLQRSLEKIRAEGVTPNTADGYVPRVYRIDMIMKHQDEFLSIVKRHAITRMGMDQRSADTFAQNVLDTVTRNRPFYDADEVIDSLDWAKNPSGVHARSLEIPDIEIEKFLESDIEVLMRHHTKTMGMDIELTAKYGSPDMKSVIDNIVADYERLMKEAPNAERRAALKKGMERDIEDIRGLRDRLRGTYGASKDPHAVSSRFIRVMKSFNVLAGMGSAMISSVPDVARTVMVEGFKNTYEGGFRQLFKEQAGYVKRMRRRELNQAAVAADAVLGLRAHAMSDIGDMFGSRYGFERGLNQATGMFFLMNGLNYWNQALKEFAGTVTMFRMNNALMTTWEALSKADKEKLLKNGIDRGDHYRIRQQIQKHGRRVENEWFANTDSWTDVEMRILYRNALNQNVERMIITPGAGDRALWTSTEMGSFITQFKSYGQGAMVRMLTSGLQERDGSFWQGAFLLVGLAAAVNEFKKAQYGIDKEESFDEKLINAVDRSGILGWAMDVNNAVEKVSDYKLGMRPFLTDQPQYGLPDSAKAGAVLGPGVSNAMNLSSIMGDVVTFNADQQTLDNARFVTPTGNLFYLDPIYDGVFGQ